MSLIARYDNLVLVRCILLTLDSGLCRMAFLALELRLEYGSSRNRAVTTQAVQWSRKWLGFDKPKCRLTPKAEPSWAEPNRCNTNVFTVNQLAPLPFHLTALGALPREVVAPGETLQAISPLCVLHTTPHLLILISHLFTMKLSSLTTFYLFE